MGGEDSPTGRMLTMKNRVFAFVPALACLLLLLGPLAALHAQNGYGLPAHADGARCEALARQWFESIHHPSLPIPSGGAQWDEWGRIVGGSGRVTAFGGIDGFANSGAWWLRRSPACLAWVRQQLEAEIPPPVPPASDGSASSAGAPSSSGEEGPVATARDREGSEAGQVEARPEGSADSNGSPAAPGSAGTPAMDAMSGLMAGAEEAGAAPANSSSQPPLDLSGPQKWVFLGDSLTVGMVGDGHHFKADVQSIFNVTIESVNTSRVGKHVTEYVREIDGILRQHPTAKYFPFLIGANDVTEYSESKANWLRGKLVTVLDKIKAGGRIPILMRASYRNYHGKDIFAEWNRKVYDPLIRRYSPRWFDEASGKGKVDVHGFLKAHPDYMAGDGCHMTSKGYRDVRLQILVKVMAAQVYGGR